MFLPDPNPYRLPAARPDAVGEERREERRDDYVLAGMLVGLGGWRVVLALATGERFDTEPTLAAIMTFLGVLLALAAFVRR